MKVVLTGANGQVGWEVCRQAADYGVTLIATTREQLDISDDADIDRALTGDIDAVINAAAYTAVDKAESEIAAATAANANAPAKLAARCAALGIPLVHISTDYVFDGTFTRAYREDDPVSPLGVYGQTKLAGEEAVRDALKQHMILRTSWVFGVHGNNFVKTMLKLADERDELRVVADQIGSPTFAGSIADAVLTMVTNPVYGTYHFCDDGPTSWHSFATHIVAAAADAGAIKHAPTVTPIATADYPTPAKRPAYTVFNMNKFTDTFGMASRPWRDGVNSVIEAARVAA